MSPALQPAVALLETDPVLALCVEAMIRAAGAHAVTVDSRDRLWEAIEAWPELVILNLAAEGWEAPVRRVKNLPHTRSIPVVAFGTRLDRRAVDAACEAGCDHVWESSQLAANLPGLLQNVLQPPTRWLEGWDEPPRAALCCGLEQFNAGEYWECHETIEALWVAETRPIRELYQGILQVGVALLHLQRSNFPGAIKMFRRALPHLRGLPEVCMGVPVGILTSASRACYRRALELGPRHLGELDLSAFPRLDVVGCEKLLP